MISRSSSVGTTFPFSQRYSMAIFAFICLLSDRDREFFPWIEDSSIFCCLRRVVFSWSLELHYHFSILVGLIGESFPVDGVYTFSLTIREDTSSLIIDREIVDDSLTEKESLWTLDRLFSYLSQECTIFIIEFDTSERSDIDISRVRYRDAEFHIKIRRIYEFWFIPVRIEFCF